MLNRVSAAELISCGKARRRLAGMCEETFENYQQVRISGGSGLAGGEGRTISKHGAVPVWGSSHRHSPAPAAVADAPRVIGSLISPWEADQDGKMAIRRLRGRGWRWTCVIWSLLSHRGLSWRWDTPVRLLLFKFFPVIAFIWRAAPALSLNTSKPGLQLVIFVVDSSIKDFFPLVTIVFFIFTYAVA